MTKSTSISPKKLRNSRPITKIPKSIPSLKQRSDPTRLYILGILFVQLCLASLRAPLYLRIHSKPLVRAAWRQGFIAVIYIPISLYDMRQSGGFGIDFTAKYKDLVAAFIAQSVILGLYLGLRSLALHFHHLYTYLIRSNVLQQLPPHLLCLQNRAEH